MKKFSHLLIVLVGLAAFLCLTAFFILLYFLIGISSTDYVKNTLFAMLSSIDYAYFLRVFVFTAIYMFFLDCIILLVVRSWRRVRDKKSGEENRSFLRRYWQGYEKIHLTFILLTLFVTISITAPSAVMNSFTAIVSISVLISSLTHKIGK